MANAGALLAVKTILYRGVVAVLQGWPALYDSTGANSTLVRPNNFARFDQDLLVPPRLLMDNPGDGDFPLLVLDYGRWNFAGDSSTPRYGDHLGGKPSGRTKTLVQTFRITLTHKTMALKAGDSLGLAVIDALESVGPTLGISRTTLPFVQRGDIDVQDDEMSALAAAVKAKNGRRAESTFTFSVTARWNQDPSPTAAP